MTLELTIFALIVGAVTSVLNLWAFSTVLKTHKMRIITLYNRLNYLEMVMVHHDLLPLPWEVEDIETEERKSFKRDGNVVYLQEE
tara:strand:- start:60355 stop:60609 length:255 start_codon:yes stop_codon:yes gene_type:complete